MTITEAMAWASGTGAASATATYSSTPAQGALLLATARGSTAFSNATFSGWTLIQQTFAATATTGPFALWYKIAGASEPTGVTITWTSSTFTALAIGAFSGILASPLDKSNFVASDGTITTSKNSGSTAVTSYPYELCVAAIGFAGTSGTITWNNSFTQRITVSSIGVATKIVTNRGIYETTPTHLTAKAGCGIIATFAGADQHGLLGML